LIPRHALKSLILSPDAADDRIEQKMFFQKVIKNCLGFIRENTHGNYIFVILLNSHFIFVDSHYN